MGFAGALAETGLPQMHLPTALLFFNVGIEVGQLVFIALLTALGVLIRRVSSAPLVAGRSRSICSVLSLPFGCWIEPARYSDESGEP
jgi:hypothetical protein